MHLTYKEILLNVQRLRKESEAKMVHADALLAEADYRVSIGALAREEAETEEPQPAEPQPM